MQTIPKVKSIVIYRGTTYSIVSCDMGGKCKIKKLRLPNRGKVLKNIDILELSLPE